MFIQEDFLYYLWKNKLLITRDLKSTSGEKIEIISFGERNPYAGPDFLNARIKIGNIEWVGNVEIHIKSSHWYLHKHETDKAYGAIILHIVWEFDVEIFDFQQNIIPTLELKRYVSPEILEQYYTFFNHSNQFIICEKQISKLTKFNKNIFVEELFKERLEEKANGIFDLLKKTQNDWEAVLFQLLMRSFGGNINGETFQTMAFERTYALIRKENASVENMEALLFGSLNLLNQDFIDIYLKDLQEIYAYQKRKYNLEILPLNVHFFGLRPANFPTIRLAQIVDLYVKEKNLFSKWISMETFDEFYTFLSEVSVSTYWKSHYYFEKQSSKMNKKITKNMAELLWINVLIPIQYSYQIFLKDEKKFNVEKINRLPSEKNKILTRFKELSFPAENALQGQALLQLYKKYCTHKKCLQCSIGQHIFNN